MTNFDYLLGLGINDFASSVAKICKEFGGNTALIAKFLQSSHPDVYSIGDYLDNVFVNQGEDVLVSFVVDGRVYESSGGRKGFLDLYGKVGAGVLDSYVVVGERSGKNGRITLNVRKK